MFRNMKSTIEATLLAYVDLGTAERIADTIIHQFQILCRAEAVDLIRKKTEEELNLMGYFKKEPPGAGGVEQLSNP